MKNKEVFRDRLEKIFYDDGDQFGIVDGEPTACNICACVECELSDFRSDPDSAYVGCRTLRKLWLEKEYKEPIPEGNTRSELIDSVIELKCISRSCAQCDYEKYGKYCRAALVVDTLVDSGYLEWKVEVPEG